MSFNKSENWKWKNWDISWSMSKQSSCENNILLVHGFGHQKNIGDIIKIFLGNFQTATQLTY